MNLISAGKTWSFNHHNRWLLQNCLIAGDLTLWSNLRKLAGLSQGTSPYSQCSFVVCVSVLHTLLSTVSRFEKNAYSLHCELAAYSLPAKMFLTDNMAIHRSHVHHAQELLGASVSPWREGEQAYLSNLKRSKLIISLRTEDNYRKYYGKLTLIEM